MKISYGRAMFRFCIIASPIINAFMLYMIYMGRSIQDITSYVILGSEIMSFWGSICFSSAGDIERERYMGTLENISSCPVDFKLIMLGKVLGNTIWGIISMVISAVFVLIFFGKTIYVSKPFWFVLGFILLILSFIIISMLLASLFTLSRNSRALMNCMDTPVYLLCGIAFPIEILPKCVRIFSYILSPTWGIRLLRMSVFGLGSTQDYLECISVLAVLVLIYGVTANFLFDKIDKKTRIDNSLGVY